MLRDHNADHVHMMKRLRLIHADEKNVTTNMQRQSPDDDDDDADDDEKNVHNDDHDAEISRS